MANKKQIKKIKKAAKKNPLVFAIIAALIIAGAIGFGIYYFAHKEPNEENHNPIISDNISINFLELGNANTGDCTYIKAGSTDILIDAGSTKGSAETIAKFLQEEGRVDDGILEYVIATHAHEDHISGFVGSKTVKGILDRFTVKNLIMYSSCYTTSLLSKDFKSKVETLESLGTKIIPADEAVGNDYKLSEGIVLNILDQKYYHTVSTNENNNSVCAMITQKSHHYLFTGDLETEGEKSLLTLNPNLPKVDLFKGAHHGSKSANSADLLAKIQPKTVCICCCAGNYEYHQKSIADTFPCQDTIDRISVYTDEIYVTTVSTDKASGFTSMNGDINYSSDGDSYQVNGSASNTKLKDTDWYKNRLIEIEQEKTST